MFSDYQFPGYAFSDEQWPQADGEAGGVPSDHVPVSLGLCVGVSLTF